MKEKRVGFLIPQVHHIFKLNQIIFKEVKMFLYLKWQKFSKTKRISS